MPSNRDSVFIHVPRCAGTSMERFFRAAGVRISPLNRTKSWCVRKNLDFSGIYGLWEYSAEWAGWFRFGFVRNPFDRTISAYLKQLERMRKASGSEPRLTVSEYVEWMLDGTPVTNDHTDFVNFSRTHVLPCTHPFYRLFDERGEVQVDYLGRFETLEADLDALCGLLRIPRRPLEHLNRSERRPYREYYDDDLERLVSEKFRMDLDLLGYRF
jgi:hypothetical protein